MANLPGVHLLPATGEFTYDPLAHQGAVARGALQSLNTFKFTNRLASLSLTFSDQLMVVIWTLCAEKEYREPS